MRKLYCLSYNEFCNYQIYNITEKSFCFQWMDFLALIFKIKNESRPFRLIKIPLTWSYNSRNFFIYYYAIFNSSIDFSLSLSFFSSWWNKRKKARWERKGKENYMKNFIKFINPVFVNKNNLNLTRKIKIKIYINKQNRKKVNSGRSFLLFILCIKYY